jgi:hypothetical protein
MRACAFGASSGDFFLPQAIAAAKTIAQIISCFLITMVGNAVCV